MPWSDKEATWQPAHGQRRVDAELHITSHAGSAGENVALAKVFDLFDVTIEQKDAAVGVQASAIAVHVAIHLHRGSGGGSDGGRI